MDYAEYRIIRKDGAVRWVDDYGHYTETGTYGGIYVVFISDITEKREQREYDAATRDAVIATLTNNYNTLWLIDDVAAEHFSLFHTDQDETHAEAIHHALSHARYTDTITEYVSTMVAKEDLERMQEQLSLPYILEQFKTKDHFAVTFLRSMESGQRYYRVHFGRVYMPGGNTGVTMGFIDVDDEVRQKHAIKQELMLREKRQKELDSIITAMASDCRSVYHVDIDADDAVCYRADPNDPAQTPVGTHFPYHARREDYDLILIDWRMPEMDGVETTRQIRSIAGHEAPIIILTSFNWDDIADEARAAGVDTFVPKPLFAGSVMDEFREAFKRKNEVLANRHVELAGRRILLAEDVTVNAEIMVI